MNSMSVLTEQELEHLVELDAVVHEEAAGVPPLLLLASLQ